MSKSTAQLVLACKVKADASSEAMAGLTAASSAIRKATEELVRAAQEALMEEEEEQGAGQGQEDKIDIFKEVRVQ